MASVTWNSEFGPKRGPRASTSSSAPLVAGPKATRPSFLNRASRTMSQLLADNPPLAPPTAPPPGSPTGSDSAGEQPEPPQPRPRPNVNGITHPHPPPPLIKRLNISLTLENSGSVARDHLASERTFLAYVRTSLAIASTGVGTLCF